MNFASFSNARAVALSCLLAGVAPRAARAEDSVRYKFQDYQERGGRIGVDSDVGRGSTFWIDLAIAEGPVERFERLASAGPPSHPVDVPEAEGVVLSVEDNGVMELQLQLTRA